MKYKTMDEVPENIKKAYLLGKYVFSPPPVCSAYWTELDWINYVTFIKQ